MRQPPPRHWRLVDGRVRARSLEVPVVDHCNLACRACSHLSPAFERRALSLEAVEQDLRRLAAGFSAECALLLGGEPLLHPDIVSAIEVVRRSGIAGAVGIETNGLLLERAPEELWRQIDRVRITAYPGHPLSAELVTACRRLAGEHAVELEIERQTMMCETHASRGTDERALIQRIYDTCRLVHEWHCHTVVDGVFYKCPQAYCIATVLGAEPGQEVADDGVTLDRGDDLGARLLAYLEAPEPLAACRRCLGIVGRSFPWQEAPRGHWTSFQEHTVEELVDWQALAREEARLGAGVRTAVRAAELECELAEVEADRARLRAELDRVRASRSWRWTAPLRALLGWWGRR